MTAAVLVACSVTAGACGDRAPARVTASAVTYSPPDYDEHQITTTTLTTPPTSVVTVPPRRVLSPGAPRVETGQERPQITGSIPDAIRAAFGSDGEKAIAVARCESTLRPEANNAGNIGLFQINWPSHSARAVRMGFTREDMFHAGPNIAVALSIFREQGWAPWACRGAH